MTRANRRWIGVALIASVTAAAGAIAWKRLQEAELPEGLAWGNGRLEAREVGIATKRPGRVLDVLVKEGDVIVAGQTLARMDVQDLEADLREAEAKSDKARQTLRHVGGLHGRRTFGRPIVGARRRLLTYPWGRGWRAVAARDPNCAAPHRVPTRSVRG